MKTPSTTKPYRALIGSLIYATVTRPDIAVSVSKLSRYLEHPQEAHWKAGIRVLRFLLTTKDKELILAPKLKAKQLGVWSDSTWNSNPDNCRSRTGFGILFHKCLIVWKTKLQPHTTLSSTEAEYVALNAATKEAIWVLRLLSEMGIEMKIPVPVFADNQSTIALAKHNMAKPRTKHIALRYHWIREQLVNGTFKLFYVPSNENLADLFTKVLGQKQQAKLLANLQSNL